MAERPQCLSKEWKKTLKVDLFIDIGERIMVLHKEKVLVALLFGLGLNPLDISLHPILILKEESQLLNFVISILLRFILPTLKVRAQRE